MHYVSTRGEAPRLGPSEIILAGLASDGGLYMPESWPQITTSQMSDFAGLSYAELTAEILAPYFDPDISLAELKDISVDVYGGFNHPQVAPLRKFEEGMWLLELFHGPTLAFKDFALQLLARLMERLAGKLDRPLLLIGATSGDTGAAAVHAFQNMDNIQLHMLHPEGRISELQRKQMTTIKAANIRNYAIRGSFDDCQAMVKRLLLDSDLAKRASLSTVNSINWGRIAAQIPYYFYASLKVGDKGLPPAFAVPSGNFGNCFSAFAASKMGLSVQNFIVGVNDNDGLRRAFEDGQVRNDETLATLSPAMDIQHSSNFERLLLEFSGRSAEKVRAQMNELSMSGGYELDEDWLRRARERFHVTRISEDSILQEIKHVYEASGILIDPHTAVGTAAARLWKEEGGQAPVVCLATAHPAKFPETIEKAIGTPPEIPHTLAGLSELKEFVTHLDASHEGLKNNILQGLET